jgi:acyl-CoA reductase-like NAD-dependent aldehyde dehydrogenase
VSELLLGEPGGIARARMMLSRAHWATTAFASYDAASVRRIAQAAADAGYANAQRYAEWAVRETGMGVVGHKRIKNEMCSRGIFEAYADADYTSARIDRERRIVEIPRAAGVVLALTPSTNPTSTVYFKVLIALMTRCAIVVSPHPLARECCVDAAHMLAEAAVRAGAPDGCIQVVEEPTIPLIEALMEDVTTDVIVATGGVGVVRAAYRSGNPAIGVGPGNVPALIDATADVPRAVERILDSKAFDNSVLCTNESVVIVEERVADRCLSEMRQHGGYVCDPDEVARMRATIFPEGRWRLDLVGKDAATIANEASIRIPPQTRVIVTPFELVVPEEPLAREKLFPVLGLVRVPDARRGIDTASAMLRIGGAGHSASIHSTDARTVMAYAAAARVLRVAVNVGNATGSAGYDTNLAPTMTVGTGFFGRSSLGENLSPANLVNWTRIAYNRDPAEAFGEFEGLDPWNATTERLPQVAAAAAPREPLDGELREHVRQVLLQDIDGLVRR